MESRMWEKGWGIESEKSERLGVLGGLGWWKRQHEQLYQRDPLLWKTGWFHVALSVLFLVLVPLDSRLILGVSPWLKPLKFALSTWIYVWTMGWLMVHVTMGRWESVVVRWSIMLVVLVENALITMQSIRGTTSHFNMTTSFNAKVFSVMAGAITWNTLVVAYVGFLFFRSSRVKPALRSHATYLWGVRWGIVLFLLGSMVGGVMGRLMKHSVGAADGGPGLPFLNWSTIAGDLRIAHFFGLHALQLLPLVGFVLFAWFKMRRTWAIHSMAALYAVGLGWVFWQALHAVPLLRSL